MSEVYVLAVLVAIGLSYYILFKDHHKRNEMTFSEIYPLVIEYVVISIVSILLIFLGINYIFTAYRYTEELSDVIKNLVIGLVIVSLVIIHFVFWVKKHRVDLVQSVREEKIEKTADIAEWIEFIVFILAIIGAILNIFKYIGFMDKVELYRQIGYSILVIVSSIMLLYNINPLGIKDKIKEKIKNRTNKK